MSPKKSPTVENISVPQREVTSHDEDGADSSNSNGAVSMSDESSPFQSPTKETSKNTTATYKNKD